MCGSQEAAEDLVQETLARMSGRWATIDRPSGYARTTLSRLVMRSRRRRDRELLQALPEAAVEPTEVDEMWRLLNDLTADHRVVLVLRYYDDCSHEQIAELLGIPVATVRTRVHRGLERLRKELER
jgi:RNA polymerase sigma factor (sigma-70 family)